MPTPAEIAAAVAALHALREKSRVGGSKWPEIEDEVRVVLEAAERASWQPIEKAPKDGSPLLGAIDWGNGEWELLRMAWDARVNKFADATYAPFADTQEQPTRWQTLPEPPTDDEPVAVQQKNTDAAGG